MNATIPPRIWLQIANTVCCRYLEWCVHCPKSVVDCLSKHCQAEFLKTEFSLSFTFPQYWFSKRLYKPNNLWYFNIFIKFLQNCQVIYKSCRCTLGLLTVTFIWKGGGGRKNHPKFELNFIFYKYIYEIFL